MAAAVLISLWFYPWKLIRGDHYKILQTTGFHVFVNKDFDVDR